MKKKKEEEEALTKVCHMLRPLPKECLNLQIGIGKAGAFISVAYTYLTIMDILHLLLSWSMLYKKLIRFCNKPSLRCSNAHEHA